MGGANACLPLNSQRSPDRSSCPTGYEVRMRSHSLGGWVGEEAEANFSGSERGGVKPKGSWGPSSWSDLRPFRGGGK